jgi:hypothetical protein
MSEFRKELTDLINKHSMENESDTPDFMLAFNAVISTREKWYGGKDNR